MILLCTVTALLLAGCPQSFVDNEWELPDLRIACKDVGYHECIATIEADLIAREGKSVYRADKDTLVFRTGPNEEFVLRNKTLDRDRSESYRYWGTLRGFHLIRVQYYEHVGESLLSVETGRLTSIFGLPHLSPTGKWVASARSGGFRPRSSNKIDIWRSDGDGFTRTFDATLPIYQPGDKPCPGAARLRWVSDDLLQVCWEIERCNAPNKAVGFIRFDGTEWHVEPVPSDE